MGGKRLKTLTNSIPQEPNKGLRDDLWELAVSCPFDQSNPDDCPFFPLRRMRPKKRVLWLNALSEQDLGYVIAYHKVCLGIRVGAGLAELRTETTAQ